MGSMGTHYSSKFRLLYLSAVQEVVVATTSGADVDLICDVTNTASQVSEITITYNGNAYTTYVTVYTVWIMSGIL